ncbi:MAG: Hsp20/alpha crystallin family protein [Thermodesulfobacteriota bacterium]
MRNTNALQAKEKQTVDSPSEHTRAGLIFRPAVDIFETDREITILADMPGVAPEDTSIDLRNNMLTLSGEVKPWEGPDEQDLKIEFEIGSYYRQFTLSKAIDPDRIQAVSTDGVLRLILPKAEQTMPKKIPVSEG